MSRTSTAQWKKVAATIRRHGRANNLPCALCHGTLGPIDYRTQGEADTQARREGTWWLIGQPRPLAFACDHITPHAAGGTDTLENAIQSHRVCNERAGAKHTPRATKPTPVIGHWEPLTPNAQRINGRAIPGTRTPTHVFQASTPGYPPPGVPHPSLTRGIENPSGVSEPPSTEGRSR